MANLQTYLIPPSPIKNLEEYRAQGGFSGFEKAQKIGPQGVIDQVKKANLRGRGGAGFPSHIKWSGVRGDTSCSTKYICCNASEGEPGTFKDRFMMRKNPFQILEGMAIAAFAIGAKGAYIGLKKKFKPELARLYAALQEIEDAGIVPQQLLNIVEGPSDYLFGEERGFLEALEGRDALPRVLPPYIQGLFYRPDSHNPTVVNNAETLAHVSHILKNGHEWFLSIGSQDTPGTGVFTLVGDVKNPGMYELPMGTNLKTLLYEIGGGPVTGAFKALWSGVANPVLTPEKFDVPMDFGSLKKAGGGLGSAGFILYDETMCMVKATTVFSMFLAKESCGQCVPCKTSSHKLTEILQSFEEGTASEKDFITLQSYCGRVNQGTRCFLSTEEALIISSLVQKFKPEMDAHIGHGCSSSRTMVLPKIKNFDEDTRQFEFEPL
jgi:NADH-quinone oxidoreductase subunit F